MATQVITKTAALALFTALGMTNADKWNAKRLAAKLAKVDEMVDANTKLEDKAADKTLTAVLKAIAVNEEIVVAENAEEKAATPAPVADKKVNLAKAIAANKEEHSGKKPKAEKTPKAEKPKALTTPGVRETKTRPYLAGVIIAKHGAEAGITEAMAKELDVAYGKTNPTESLFCLRNAWHAVRGHKDQTAAQKK